MFKIFVFPDGKWCWSDHAPQFLKDHPEYDNYRCIEYPSNYKIDNESIERYLATMDTEKPMPDVINHPHHYTNHPSGIEPIQITRYEDFLTGNIIKYVMRHRYKGKPLEDLKKAQFYLNERIRILEEGATWDIDGNPEVHDATT